MEIKKHRIAKIMINNTKYSECPTILDFKLYHSIVAGFYSYSFLFGGNTT